MAFNPKPTKKKIQAEYKTMYITNHYLQIFLINSDTDLTLGKSISIIF